jgi:hypothetical protein
LARAALQSLVGQAITGQTQSFLQSLRLVVVGALELTPEPGRTVARAVEVMVAAVPEVLEFRAKALPVVRV